MTTPADPTGPLPGTANHQTGPVTGPTVQAGTINGDVHFHAPPVYPPRPLYVPGPTRVPIPRLSPTSAFLRKWFPVLLVPMAMGLAVGGVVDSAVGREALPIRLLGVAVVLGTASLVLFVMSKFSSVTVDGVVERCTPKVLASVSTAGLWWWLAVLIALTCTGIGHSMPVPAGDPSARGASGALSAFFVLIIMVVALLVRRRRR